MSDLIRDAAIGQIIRWVTRNKYLQYPEEKSDFELPETYKSPGKPLETPTESSTHRSPRESVELEKEAPADLEKVDTQKTQHRPSENLARIDSRRALSRSHTTQDLERQLTQASLKKQQTAPIVPEVTKDGTVLVDWYDTDDAANPQNWGAKKKAFITLQLGLYTTAVYMGSSIYSASEQAVTQVFGVSITAAELGLSLYVLAYGTGPMLWSPLSEVPLFGRNPPYIMTFAIFTILCLPTALVQNFPGLLVLRFLQGFFGSPCLATGGATLADMYNLQQFPYVLSLWSFAATCGPALGPMISGFSVPAENWRWSLWEMLWMAGPIWILLFLCLPETYTPNILLRRARRIRKVTSTTIYKSQSEIDQSEMSPTKIAIDQLIKPFQLNLLDPSIAFTSVYVALVYGIYYSFFEVFPFVYIDMYHFNEGELGLTFLSITVGVIMAIGIYWAYLYWVVSPQMAARGPGAPEQRLVPALYASFCLPVGMFIFAWTANPNIHWIVTIIGLTIFAIGIFIVIQCLFVYLPMTYPQYAASLFAGNDFLRSAFAAGAILFSRPMFLKLGVGKGASLLASLMAGCIAGVFVLYFFGHKLRARSRFAAKPSENEEEGMNGDEELKSSGEETK